MVYDWTTIAHHMPSKDADKIYPRISLAETYRTSVSFVDPNKNAGQVYPGFEVTAPVYKGKA